MSEKLKARVLVGIAAAVALIVVSDVVSGIPAPGDGRSVWALLLAVAAFVVFLAPAPGGGVQVGAEQPDKNVL